MAPELIGAEMQRARRKDPAGMDAWDCVMRANWHAWRLTVEDNAEAKNFAGQAIGARSPHGAGARGARHVRHLGRALRVQRQSAQVAGQRPRDGAPAVELDPRDAEAHTILGVVTLFTRDFDDAPRRLETALSLNPNLAFADMWGGGYYAFTSEPARAREYLTRALRLSPRDPANYWTYAFFGLADFSEGHYEDAAEWALKAIHLQQDFPTAHRLLAASYSRLGLTAQAEAAIEGLLAIAPGTTIARTRAGVPWKDPAIMDRYLDALRNAGLPE